MPLRDAYRWRNGGEVPVPSVWLTWAANLVRQLNHTLLPERYVAHLNVHGGSDPKVADETESYTVAEPAVTRHWLCFDAYRPPECEVRVKDREAGYEPVGVLELLLPWTKARPVDRSRFLAKCVANLTGGLGVAVVDAIPGPGGSLHNDLVALLGAPPASRLPADSPFTATYRMDTVDSHPMASAHRCPLVAGEPLPAVPLPLRDGPEVMIDLEAAYLQSLADLNL
jgi:hypothetical protein